LINSVLKHEILQSLIFALAIAVGITPDLLPAIMSVTMAVGSKKMSKKGVIVKKLSSIPNLGGMNILCTDKTGTLTENKIVLKNYINFLGKKDESLLNLVYLNSTLQTGIRNPLDDAVIKYKKINTKGFKKIGEVPYDFFRKRMSVIVKKGKEATMITKGAPEEMLDICSHYTRSNKIVSLDKRAKLEAMKKYNELSDQGQRVLAVATKKIEGKRSYAVKDEDNLVFEGFVSFYDPPKRGVEETIKEMRELGIEIKIITGDNELVTERVAKEVGLKVKGLILGSELDKLSDEDLKNKVQNITIFARCSPDEKSRIISALRSANNVVGYLGDGINDAPAIRNSDVGISVNNAVDIAKESASIILTRKSLSDLKEGVIDGRKIFGNTMKYMMMATSSNFGNIFTVSITSLFLPFLPILPAEILFSNLIYDASQITIPSDNVDKDWVNSPKKWDVTFLRKFMYVFGPLSSVFDFITFAILLLIVKVSVPVFQTTWFLESFATQILVFHFIRTKGSIFKSRASLPLIITTIAGVVICWVTPFTYLGTLLGLVPVPLYLFPIIISINIVYFASVEIVKRQFYKRNKF
jgi:Mg2+-importing ATPase